MDIILIIISFIISKIDLICAILEIILFWKLWAMTNNVAIIKKFLLEQNKKQMKSDDLMSEQKFNVGQVVVHLATEDQMKIKEIQNGKYACYCNSGTKLHGLYSNDEIADFQEYWKMKK